MNVREVLEFAKKHRVQMVDLKFIDLPGVWQHMTIPVSELTETLFKDGSGLDGSSIRGWKAINNSDLLVVPDPATAFLDPFTAVPTLSLTGNVVDPISRENYERDPRFIAQKAERYLQSTKIGDNSFWGPEAEFFIFDHARYDQTSHSGFYYLDSEEGAWNMGQEGINLGGKLRHKQGYFPVAPADTQQDIRSEMVLEMEKIGIEVEKHHHETATAGQAEIDIRFDTLLRTADKMMMYKYIVKNVARRHGKTVTFMPKPLFGDAGSGMHTHQSIWKEGKPLFAGKDYAGISQLCLYYIGGILKHAPALAAFTNPTTNSYKRITPGFEAPVLLAYSSRNRSAGVRIPMYSPSPKAKRIEVRFPDPSCNPYLAFSKDATIKQAGQLLQKYKVGSLIVDDGSRYIGIVTDSDLTRKAVAKGLDPNTTTVATCMSRSIVTIEEDESLSEARALMKKQGIRHLPVTADATIIGVLAVSDLLRAFEELKPS
ncbi:MAG: type I glutamate--ammonia ligase [Nitrospira sp.]|nr:type I glutamate--ammonia ligase [Nitrospira sp.]